ncbi:MAG: DUF92 domain-containing protein [Vicinamibacterales bacterium]
MSRYTETGRQIVHVAMVGFAFALRWLSWPQAAGLALVALAFNYLLLPRLAPAIMRETDHATARAGILFYPLAVLALVLVFRERLELAAAAWGVMAAGDGFATLVGTTIGGPALPWNREKTWSGFGGFVVTGTAAAVVLWTFVGQDLASPPHPAVVLWGSLAAGLIAGLVETIPVRLDDNLSVPAAAGAAMWVAAESVRWPLSAGWADQIAIGLALNVVVGLAAWARGKVTSGGALTGIGLGTLVYLGGGLAGWLVLGMSFLVTVISTKAGHARKHALGIAEERGGRRGAANVLANCLVGAVGAWLSAAGGGAWPGWAGGIVLVTGLAAGGSDSVASEIGKAFGGTPRLLPGLRAVTPGTPGAISVAGTCAGMIAAAVIALPAVALSLLPLAAVPLVVLASTTGAVVESLLATHLEHRQVLNNDLLNVLNTAAAAAVALALANPAWASARVVL